MVKIKTVLLSVLVLSLTLSINVKAQTDEDLLEVYGKSSNSLIKQNIENQIEDIEENISDVQYLKRMNEKYNAIIDEYNTEQQKKFKLINNTVSSYIESNKEISETISTQLDTLSIQDLKKMDAAFKANITKMNEIVQSLDNVVLITDYKQTEFNLDELYLTVDSLHEQYEVAIDAEEIGDVTDIKWIMNNDYFITSKFGYRVDPISGSRIQYHSGVDFRCSVGTEVGALFNGTVIDVGYAASAGKYITVQSSDRVKYYYCHLDSILVEKGDTVKQYETIALSGATGARCTGPHLHLSLYINGVAYDVSKLFENKLY